MYKMTLSRAWRGLMTLLLLGGTAVNGQQKETMYLSGTDNEHTVAWDFYCTGGRKSGYWTTIQVPSCWEQQGFGTYNYGRDYRTFGKNYRMADEQGIYKYRFTLPAAWKQKELLLVFEGSMTDTEVKINGKTAGARHQGAFYRFSYDISGLAEPGKENLLEVRVSKMSANASVNNAERLADYWIFGGIFRPVYVEAYPKTYISHTAVDGKANGHFGMNVFVKNLERDAMLETVITNQAGTTVATLTTPVRAGDSLVYVETKVDNPLPWTAETPNLYKVQVALKQGRKVLYQTGDQFGFRTIEIRHGDGIYVNGVQVKMKGINRHVFWPETGRTVNPTLDLQDVQLIKEMNMNAVRCAHYPPDQSFLRICDSLGLYVLDELAGWQQAYATPVGEKLVKEMVQRDANHPSIIFWSNGNEGGTNKALDDDFAKYDLSARPVIHAHHRPGNDYNGIDCNHYEDYYSTQKILADSLIYMPTEFLHSQDDGGGGAALNDFWELHWHAKRSGGGFLWSFIDEGVVRTDRDGQIDVNGVNAPDGVLGPHREKEGSFYAIREIYSPVKITMTTLPVNFDGTIPVENRYHSTNLSQCRFTWQLREFKQPGDETTGYKATDSGTITAPVVAPGGAKGVLQLALPAGWQKQDALALAAYDPFGKLIYEWVWKISPNSSLIQGMVQLTGTATVNEDEQTITLRGGEVSVSFSKKDGSLIKIANKAAADNLSFGKGPLPAYGEATFKAIRQYREGDAQVVEVQYEGALQYARWTMHGSGWLELHYAYRMNGSQPFMGISFTYPENYILETKWLGKGPYRVWKNRMQGVTENVWESMYNNTHTGSAPWRYPEFKGYFADITWMELSTVEGKFLVASPDSGLFVRLFDFYGLSGVDPFPPLPAGNISFLDGIPPIGTKLALRIDTHTSRLGPASEWNADKGELQRTLYFYFGLPRTANTKETYSRPEVDEVF